MGICAYACVIVYRHVLYTESCVYICIYIYSYKCTHAHSGDVMRCLVATKSCCRVSPVATMKRHAWLACFLLMGWCVFVWVLSAVVDLRFRLHYCCPPFSVLLGVWLLDSSLSALFLRRWMCFDEHRGHHAQCFSSHGAMVSGWCGSQPVCGTDA